MKRPGKKVDPNVCVFETELFATKPEIKQYLEKVYNLKVLKVNTLITNGKIKKTMMRQRYREPDIKKAYVYLDQEVSEKFKSIPFK